MWITCFVLLCRDGQLKRSNPPPALKAKQQEDYASKLKFAWCIWPKMTSIQLWGSTLQMVENTVGRPDEWTNTWISMENGGPFPETCCWPWLWAEQGMKRFRNDQVLFLGISLWLPLFLELALPGEPWHTWLFVMKGYMELLGRWNLANFDGVFWMLRNFVRTHEVSSASDLGWKISINFGLVEDWG